MRSFVPPDAESIALLGHDLRAAMSEVIGGLCLIDPALLPPAPRAQIARSRAASEALALLLEQALALLPPAPQPPLSQAPLQTNRLQNCHLLIVDDDASERHLLGQLLSNQGAQITAAADGPHAISLLAHSRFDALLVDIEMPRMSGLAVIRHIRSQTGPLARLPILAITAYRLRANKAAILAAGADGLLCKPVQDAEHLGKLVVQVLRQGILRDDAPPQVEPAQFQELLQMAGPKMAAELLNHLQNDLRAAERGLLAAAHGPDWPEVRRQTHVMIALAGTAGATLLHQLAQALNVLAHQPKPDPGSLHSLLPQALEQLDMLIHFIDQKIFPAASRLPPAPPVQEPQ